MSDPKLTIEQILALLAGHPQQIAAATVGLTAEQLHAAPNPGEWSAVAILAHLRSCADVWGGCIVEIVEKDHPTIRAINPRTWIERTEYRQQEFQPALAAFTAHRAELLSFMNRLTTEDWARTATVTGAGRPIERNVYWYGVGLASHERSHVKQFARIAKEMQAQK